MDCVDIAVEGGCVEIVVDSFIAVGRKCVRNCNICGFGCRLCCLASSWHHGSRGVEVEIYMVEVEIYEYHDVEIV